VRAREAGLVLLATAAGAVGIWAVAYGYEQRARPDFCVAAALAAALCWRLARRTLPPPDPPPATPETEPAPTGLLVLTSLESRLSWGAADPDRFRERVRPLLVELATDRLRSRHGVDPRTDPEQARTVLGEPLWQLMTAPPTRSPSRAELDRLVTAIERI
jgi:hypothetical protein